jgi:hypothetical protein
MMMDEVHWIEAEELVTDKNENDDDETPDVGDLFADPDPYDTFNFQFGKIQIHIQGHKMENGQTLHSTGLTLWRASPLLCEYMMTQQDFIRERTVLEVYDTVDTVPCVFEKCHDLFVLIYFAYRIVSYTLSLSLAGSRLGIMWDSCPSFGCPSGRLDGWRYRYVGTSKG